jgi:RNA polymerase sigma-70 factor (ECF subfamily)
MDRAPCVVLRGDGGGLVKAARRPVRGTDRVARPMVGVTEWSGDTDRRAPALANGRAATRG